MKDVIFNPNRLLHYLYWILIALILCLVFIAADYWDGVSDYHYIGPRTESPPGKAVWEPITEDEVEPPVDLRSHPDWREERIIWAPAASIILLIVIGLYVFYVFPTVNIYHNAKKIGRNSVRWATACVVFTPVLAGIAYLLTWPKNKN